MNENNTSHILIPKSQKVTVSRVVWSKKCQAPKYHARPKESSRPYATVGQFGDKLKRYDEFVIHSSYPNQGHDSVFSIFSLAYPY